MKWRAISQFEIEWRRARTSLGSWQLGGALRSSASPSIEDLSSTMKSAELAECPGMQLHAASSKCRPWTARLPPMHGRFGGWRLELGSEFRSKEKNSLFVANVAVLRARA